MIGANITGSRRPQRWPVRYLLVTGDSMAPTLRDGDWVLARGTARARVGQVVVAQRPGHRMLLVKRVIEVTPRGYWLAGDNPAASTDSRHFGPVSQILARVVWRVRPWGPVSLPGQSRPRTRVAGGQEPTPPGRGTGPRQ